jgi:hypothetical protein
MHGTAVEIVVTVIGRRVRFSVLRLGVFVVFVGRTKMTHIKAGRQTNQQTTWSELLCVIFMFVPCISNNKIPLLKSN